MKLNPLICPACHSECDAVVDGRCFDCTYSSDEPCCVCGKLVEHADQDADSRRPLHVQCVGEYEAERFESAYDAHIDGLIDRGIARKHGVEL